jgi:hypothetical protein
MRNAKRREKRRSGRKHAANFPILRVEDLGRRLAQPILLSVHDDDSNRANAAKPDGWRHSQRIFRLFSDCAQQTGTRVL